MDKTSLTFQTLRNASYSFTSYIWPLFFSIIITPIIVLRLGAEQYGFLIFINAVSAFVGIISGGADSSSIRQLAYYHAQNNREKIRRLVTTMHSVFLIIAIVGSTSIIAGFFVGAKILSPGVLENNELLILFLLSAGHFFVQTSIRFFCIIPNALQRFDKSAVLSMTSLTLMSLGNLVLVLAGYGVMEILSFQLIFGIFMAILWVRNAKKLLPESTYGIHIYFDEFKKSFKFGSLSSLNEFARTSLISLDRLLIPLFGGVTQLTYYSVPGNLAARIPSTADNLSGIIFPAATNLHSSGYIEKLQTLYLRSSRLISTISIAITVAIIFNSQKILQYWLDESFAQNSTHILIILALTNLILSLLSPIASFFMGMNKLKFNTILSFVMAALNIGFLIYLLPRYGITGAAWAYFISVLPIFFAVYIVEKRYLHLQRRLAYYVKFSIKHILVTTITALIIYMFINPLITSFTALAVFGPLSVILYLLTFFLFGFFEKEDVSDISRFTSLIYSRVISIKKIKIDRNKMEERKLNFKLFIRKFIPSLILKKIRRRQVPLHKILGFLKEYKVQTIHEDTKTNSLSIIMPCYEHASHIKKALESILKQSRLPDELVIVNDNSQDGTKEIIDDFEKSKPDGIKLTAIHNEENVGQALSINKAILASQSDLVMIMNDDDYLFSDSVERMLELFKQNPNLALIGGSQVSFKKDTELEQYSNMESAQDISKDFFSTNFSVRQPEEALAYEDYCSLNMTHTSSTFSREKAISAGLYREKHQRIVKFSDRDFQIRMNLLYPVATSSTVSFTFWRSDTSVDSGRNS